MGVYINPKYGESKEQWLINNGKYSTINSEGFKNKPTETLPVMLVDNGVFSAAGICFSEEEYKVFNNPDDLRPKKLYYVDIQKLNDVSPELKDYIDYDLKL